MVAISQMTPGPIAINASTFVGMKLAGVGGAVLATFGCAFPTSVLALIAAYYYYKYQNMSLIKGIFEGLRPAIVSMIATAGLSILLLSLFNVEVITSRILDSIDWNAVVMFAISLFILRKWKPNPIFILLLSGAVGAIIYLFIPSFL